MSQNEAVLNHLRQHGALSPLKARHVYGIERLTSRIHDLKRMGHRIKVSIRRDPLGGRYAEYTLEDAR